MKLLVSELQRMLLTSSTKIPFSWIIDSCLKNGYSAEEIKKELLSMREKGIIQIDREDFMIIDFMSFSKSHDINEWINE